MTELKPCPFCGGEVRLQEITQDPYELRIEIHCPFCNMTFTHNQQFALSTVARVALSDSFINIWNGRADNG